MGIKIAYYSHGGKEENQDSILIKDEILNMNFERPINKIVEYDRNFFIALSDGLNNHRQGKFASKYILSTLNNQLPFLTFGGKVVEALTKTQEEMVRFGKLNEEYYSMGGTLSGLYFDTEKISFFSVGDSRIYKVNKNHLLKISRDHSIVEELHEKGIITRDMMGTHELSEYITSAIMAYPRDTLDIYMNEEDFGRVEGLYIICTDGLWKNMRHKELEETINNEVSLWSKGLIELLRDKRIKVNHSYIIIKIE